MVVKLGQPKPKWGVRERRRGPICPSSSKQTMLHFEIGVGKPRCAEASRAYCLLPAESLCLSQILQSAHKHSSLGPAAELYKWSIQEVGGRRQIWGAEQSWNSVCSLLEIFYESCCCSWVSWSFKWTIMRGKGCYVIIAQGQRTYTEYPRQTRVRGHCRGLNCVPPKNVSVEGLTISAWECEFICR